MTDAHVQEDSLVKALHKFSSALFDMDDQMKAQMAQGALEKASPEKAAELVFGGGAELLKAAIEQEKNGNGQFEEKLAAMKASLGLKAVTIPTTTITEAQPQPQRVVAEAGAAKGL